MALQFDGPRLLAGDDAAACLGLDRLALGGLWSDKQWRTELEAPGRPCLGIERAGELVALACGWLILEELHVGALAVHPGWRRRGLGRRVLDALLGHGRDHGAERATLEVAAGNSAALALYGAAGFRTAGRRRAYYRDGQDALIQWLDLRTGPGGTAGP